MTLTWDLLIDGDMTEDDWQFSEPTTHNLLRIEQINPPEIGRFALGQATVDQFEFLDIKAYPAREESTRITLDAVGVDSRRIAIRYRYAQFPEGVANTWQVKVYGTSAEFQPAVNPSAIVLTLDPRIAGAIPLEEKGIPLGVASLDENGLVEEDQLPSTGLAELVAANLEAVDALSDQINSLPPPPTLTDLGGEPAGAEVRAKAYTDEQIEAIVIPPPPTLTDLGGEPVGAETRAKAYTDEQIEAIVIPPPPTLTDLGAEPAGAETRAKAYTDQSLSLESRFQTSHLHIWGMGRIITNNTRFFNTTLSTSAELCRWAAIDTPGVGDVVEYEILLKAGAYTLVVYGQKQSDRGIAGFYVDNRYVGRFDLYNSSASSRNLQLINFTITFSGWHSIKVATVGKNSASSNYFLSLSAIYIRPQEITLVTPFQPIRVNCGATADYTDPSGNVWGPTLFADGGNNYDIESQVGAYTVTGTDKQTLYKTETSLDSGSFSYKLPIFSSGSGYRLNLHFSENFHNSAGARVGSVAINGSTVLSNFDIFAQAGGKNKALIKTFENLSLSGSLVLAFTNILINAIELIKP